MCLNLFLFVKGIPYWIFIIVALAILLLVLCAMFIFCSTKKTRQKARDERFKKNLGIYIGDVASREAPNNKGGLVVEIAGKLLNFLDYLGVPYPSHYVFVQ